jgi:hypothetical protein
MHSIYKVRFARFISLAAAVLLLSLSAVGCHVTTHGGGGVIGDPCEFDSDCGGLPGGFCTSAGICSMPCAFHEDCGCASGTTTADIFNGACGTSCDFSLGVCMQVCRSTSECANAAVCGFYDGYPYSTCF